MTTRRKFLSGAAAVGAALPIAGAHAAGLNGGFGGVLFESLSSAIITGVGGRAANASVFVPNGNAMISSYFDANSNPVGSQLPNLGTNGANSIFGSLLIWIKETLDSFTSKRVLFSAVDRPSGNVNFEVSLWPGSIPATTADQFNNPGTHTGSPYLVVRAMSMFMGQQIIDSWVVTMDAWQGNTPMLLAIAMNGAIQDPYGLVVKQFFQGILPGNGYSSSKTVQYGFSNAARPPVGLNRTTRGLKNSIPWGSTQSLTTNTNNQLAFTVGGNLFENNTGGTGLSIGGVIFEPNYAGNLISAQSALYNSYNGSFMLPNNLGFSLSRGANVLGASSGPPVVLFGQAVPLSDTGTDNSYFGYNFGTNAPVNIVDPHGIPDFLELDTSFQKPAGTDTLVEDPSVTNFFP